MGIVCHGFKTSYRIERNSSCVHATIKKVTEDIESLSFNTAISQMMIFVNAFTKVEKIPVSSDANVVWFCLTHSRHI